MHVLHPLALCLFLCTIREALLLRVPCYQLGVSDELYSTSLWSTKASKAKNTLLLKATPFEEVGVAESSNVEAMFSVSYDPLEVPSQKMRDRDLEDLLRQRSKRFFDSKLVRLEEKCYLVGLEDKSQYINSKLEDFTLEESLSELSELAGAAGLKVVGSTYQRVQQPNVEYYIGEGKTKEIARNMDKLKCSCVVFDTELSPSQQKNLELAFNQESNANKNSRNRQYVKVIDRTALILDIFAQHARTKEGQLQVQLALLTYRLPRLTKMWSHLERQSSASKGKSNGGVGLRGPGEKQLESDRREMKVKISVLKKAIDSLRVHRTVHRLRRKRLGVPIAALVGYTNSGKSSLLNSVTDGGVFAADMLFATLDPTTRMVHMSGKKMTDVLCTDTVGFIQRLPTNLIAAFRATLEELHEADVLIHVIDVSNPNFSKQEAAVLSELSNMGLADKPIVTVLNKIDLLKDQKDAVIYEAEKRINTIPISTVTGEGLDHFMKVLQDTLAFKLEDLTCSISYELAVLEYWIRRLGYIEQIEYLDDFMTIQGRIPSFLHNQIKQMANQLELFEGDFMESEIFRDLLPEGFRADSTSSSSSSTPKIIFNSNPEDIFLSKGVELIDWKAVAKGRHSVCKNLDSAL